jgi:hypothetical protein
MKTGKCLAIVAACIGLAGPAAAQVQVDQVAGAGLPAGQVMAPSVSGGAALFGTTFMLGDIINGWHLYDLVDPTNTDYTNGQLVFDSSLLGQDSSLGGQSTATACSPFCSVGQVTALDPSGSLFLTAYDKQSIFTKPGVYRVLWPNSFVLLAPKQGSGGGDAPTAVVFNPADGKTYYGGLNTGALRRITQPLVYPTDPQTIETFGNNPNGRPSRAMAIVNGDLYIAHDQGLAVVHNVANCSGDQNGCGNALVVKDGMQGQNHSGMVFDGTDHLYLAVVNTVWRYTISTGALVQVTTSSFTFCPNHTSMMMIDGHGDFWFGDDPSCGAQPDTGRLWRIPVTRLGFLS